MFERSDITLVLPGPWHGKNVWFESLKGFEAAGECFRYELTFIAEDRELMAKDALGAPVTLTVSEADADRHYNALVDEFHVLGLSVGINEGGFDAPDMMRYQLILRPTLWFLSKATDNRIFQEMSVPAIIEDVLGAHGFNNFRNELIETYDPREYCVQYGESDLNFLERQMQHEGIWYYFEHADDSHTMVLVDRNTTVDDGVHQLEFRQDRRPESGLPEITEWRPVNRVVSSSWTQRDYDFERPSANLEAKDEFVQPGGLMDRARYTYPGDYTQQARGDFLTQKRNIMAQVETHRATALSEDMKPVAGSSFTMTGQPRESENGQYLILRNDFELWAGAWFAGQPSVPDDAGYRAWWTVQPLDLPFAPPMTARPAVMRGPQTAVVVGPGGEEIYTDQYSRVKVQFFWDRDGGKDENSTCWIRVSSAWAGSGWGFIQIPRIGQEVIVDFLEGDPDQPIVTGRVYNAEQMPPYALPDNATQSGWKSNSSPGGGGWNELRFEDKKGSEEVWFQAEKDHNELVKNNESRNIGNDFYENVGHDARQEIENDRSEWVGNDKDTTVDKNRTVVIGVDDTESVGANRSLSVGANETIAVGSNSTETIGSNHTQTVGMNQTIAVALNRTDAVAVAESRTVGAAQSITVGGARSVAVGVTQSTQVGMSDSWSVGTDRSVDIGKDLTESVGKNATQVVGENLTISVGKKLAIDAGDEILIKTGSASILMKKDGTIQIKGKDIKIDGSGKIDAKAGSSIKIKGSKIDLN